MTMNVLELDKNLHSKLKAADAQWQTTFEQLPVDQNVPILVLCDEANAYAWLSLWLKNTPSYQGFKTACIGNYYAQTPHAAQKILKIAQDILCKQKFEYMIVPMDGNTWHNYRLTDQLYTEPAFFMEKLTPLEWHAHFKISGFECIANYASTSNEDLDYVEIAAPEWQQRFESDSEYHLRPLNLENIDAQLEALYELSLQGFKRNFLYTDITLVAFKALYQPVLPLVVPELVQMAYVKNQLAGFVFAVPDYAQKARGEKIDTLILKTVVRHPAPEFKGLGAYLIWNTHQIAKANGYRRVITAFIHDPSESLRISLKTGEIIREYALYGKPL